MDGLYANLAHASYWIICLYIHQDELLVPDNGYGESVSFNRLMIVRLMHFGMLGFSALLLSFISFLARHIDSSEEQVRSPYNSPARFTESLSPGENSSCNGYQGFDTYTASLWESRRGRKQTYIRGHFRSEWLQDIFFGTEKPLGLHNTLSFSLLAVMGAFSQMTLAWALDQVVDLNNGLDISHPLEFSEELLCLAAMFTWSGVVLIISLAINMLFKRERTLDKDESMPAFIRVSFIVLALYTCLNAVVRT